MKLAPDAELAHLDETRSLLAQLLQLAAQREAALAAQTEGLRVPPIASDAGEGSSLPLTRAMEDQPNFMASSSLLGPPPGTQVLETRTEERFQRLAQARTSAHARPSPALSHAQSLPRSSTRRSRTSRCLLLLHQQRPAAAAHRPDSRVQWVRGGLG